MLQKAEIKVFIEMEQVWLEGVIEGYYSLKLMKDYQKLSEFLMDVDSFEGKSTNIAIN